MIEVVWEGAHLLTTRFDINLSHKMFVLSGDRRGVQLNIVQQKHEKLPIFFSCCIKISWLNVAKVCGGLYATVKSEISNTTNLYLASWLL